MTHVFIDRGTERICLTYEIETAPRTDESETQRDERLDQLLSFIYERVLKLDQERRYARYYSSILAPFKKTSVEMNFSFRGCPLPCRRCPDSARR